MAYDPNNSLFQIVGQAANLYPTPQVRVDYVNVPQFDEQTVTDDLFKIVRNGNPNVVV